MSHVAILVSHHWRSLLVAGRLCYFHPRIIETGPAAHLIDVSGAQRGGGETVARRLAPRALGQGDHARANIRVDLRATKDFSQFVEDPHQFAFMNPARRGVIWMDREPQLRIIELAKDAGDHFVIAWADERERII